MQVADRRSRADILIERGRITGIGPDLAASTTTTGQRARRARPAGHSGPHQRASALTGQPDARHAAGLPLEVFMLYEVPPLADGAVDPRGSHGCALPRRDRDAEARHHDACSTTRSSCHSPPAARSTRSSRPIATPACARLSRSISRCWSNTRNIPFWPICFPDEIKRQMELAPRETEAGMLAHYRLSDRDLARRGGWPAVGRRLLLRAATRDQRATCRRCRELREAMISPTSAISWKRACSACSARRSSAARWCATRTTSASSTSGCR